VAHYSYPSGIGGAPGFRDHFMLTLRDNGERNSAGYPVHLRRIALANGKLDGLLPSNNAEGEPGGSIFDVNIYTRFWGGVGATLISFFGVSYQTTSATTSATTHSRFLPNPGSNAVIFSGITHQVQNGKWGVTGFPTKIKAAQVTGGAQGCWDLAPGGLRSTHRQLHDPLEGAAQGELYKVSVTDVHDNHCFIPTISALGFQYQSLSNYQSTSSLPNPFTNLLGRDLVCTGEIPFDAYYAPATTNTFHVMPDNTGLLFLGRELSRTAATPTFAVFKATLCPGSSATAYSVNPECTASRPGQAQPATTYVWTVGTGLQLISGQGTASVQIQPASGYTGNSTVQVVATRSGYAASAPLSRAVRIGPPELIDLQEDSEASDPCLNIAWFTILNYDPLLTYSGTGLAGRVGDGRFRVKGRPGSSSAAFTITVTNACGSTSTSSVASFPDCGYRYAAHPNPADDDLTIEQTSNDNSSFSAARSASAAATAGSTPFTVRLYDMYGTLHMQQTASAATLQLPVATLPAGLYLLRIEAGGKLVESHQLQITH